MGSARTLAGQCAAVRRRVVFVAMVGLGLIVGQPSIAETQSDCVQGVCIQVSQNDDRAVIEVSNAQPVPVGVRVIFESLQNLVAVPAQNPADRLVPPGERAAVVTLVRQNARLPASYPFRWQWVWGDPRARHDDAARYRMPFGGTTDRVLSQGVNGRFSHKDQSRYSFDFAMPIGTPILAARSGRVVDVADGYTKSGTVGHFLREANAITILHEDGTFATYAHLDAGSGVRRGMHVAAGDLIGFSGNTGFSTGPHLHFSVWKAGFDGTTGTVPIRFHDGSPGGFVPAEAVAYRPGCHARGRPCGAGELPASQPASLGAPAEGRGDGPCRCKNGAVITTHLPCRMVCP
jgi:murein DD-endopeptidase MepM/ murein hydrolase activator NlpD